MLQYLNLVIVALSACTTSTEIPTNIIYKGNVNMQPAGCLGTKG